MATANNPESAPVFFVGVKGDVTIKDETGNKIKLKKGDKIPVDAKIIVGDGGTIVFKQENKILKYESQGEASLSNALTESSDASQDPGIQTLVEAAEQIIATPDRPSQEMPAQQPLAKPVARTDTSTLTPTPAKEGVLEPPFIVPIVEKADTQSDASEIVKEMAEQIAARSDALGASTTESEEVLSSAGETLTFEHSHKHIVHNESPLPPAAPAVTSFAPNTGSGDDNITSEKKLTISGVAPTGTQVTLLCDDVVIKQGIQVSSQGQWSTQWNTGKDGSFTLTATASSGTASSAPSSALSVQVDSKPPALEFDHPASDDNYNFVTYNKAAIITGTTTPGQTFTLTQGNNGWKITADDKGTWSQAVANLSDGLTEFSASMASVAGVEVTKTAKLLVQSTPYDFKIQPDTGTSDTDNITNSEDLLLTVKSQPDATVVLTILGKDIKSTVNKDGQAEFKITLAGDDIYTCQLKTLYADNGGESDTVEETITLDTTPAAFNLDQLQTTYKDPDISFSGQCKENGSTVSIKLVNVFKPGVSVSTTATVENGTFNATATVPEQGQYRAEVTIVDAAGNTSFPQDYPFEYQPPKPELIIQTRPDDSSSNANPEWTGTFPHEGKLEISFAGKTDTITVKSDNTWSYQFSDAFDFARHTVTFTGSQTGLAGTAIEQDSFSVVMPTMQLTINKAPAEHTNLTQTEWKGSGAAPNAKVTLTLTPTKGDVAEETVNADDQGFFAIALSLNEGSYSTALTATADGYQDSSLIGDNVTIDRTGPVVEVDPGFKPTAGNNTMTGTATDKFGNPEPNGSVVVHLNTGQSYVGSIKAGHFSIELKNLSPDNAYTAEVIGSDDLNNIGKTKYTTFKTPPLPTMSLTLDTEPADRIDTVQTQWKGSGAAPNAKVTLILKPTQGSEIKNTVTADNKGQFVFKVTGLTETSYTPELSASASGYQDASLAGKLLTVDTTGPVLTLDPNVMTSLKATSKSLLLSGSSTDQNGKVTATLGSKTYNGTITGGHFTVKVTGLLPGKHYTVKLVGTDDVGNKGQEVSENFQVPPLGNMSLKLDTEPADRINTAQTQWKGSGAAPNAKVTLILKPTQGSEIKNTVTADNKGQFVFKVTGLTETSYTPELSASASGYQDASLAGKLFTVDTTGPVLTLDPNVTTSLKATSKSLLLSGSSTDQNGKVTATLGSKTYNGTITGGHFTVKVTGLLPGKHYTVKLVGTDDVGNKGQEVSENFQVPPLGNMSLKLDTEPADRINTAQTQWKGSGAAPNAKVTLTLKTTAQGSEIKNTVTADNKGQFIFKVTGLTETSYTPELSASASGYNDGNLTGKLLTVDTTGPVLTLDPNVMTSLKATSKSLLLSGSSTDQNGKVTATLGSKTYNGTITGSHFTVKVTGLLPGKHYTVKLVGTDDVGNKGQEVSENFRVPPLGNMSLKLDTEPADRINTAQTQWKGSGAAPNAKVTLTLKTTAQGSEIKNTVTADNKGQFVFKVTGLTETSYIPELSASASGYQDASLAGKLFTVDTTGPVLTLDPNVMTSLKATSKSLLLSGSSTDQNGKVTATLGSKTYNGTITGGHFTVKVTGLLPGKHYTVKLVGTDDVGNKGQEVSENFRVPPLGNMSLKLDTEPADRINTAQTQWKGSGAAPNAKVTLILKPTQGSEIKNTVTADNKGQFIFKVTGLTETSYTPELSASASGYQDASLTGKLFTVDTTGPTLMIDSNFQLTAGTCTLKGKALDQSGQPEPKGSVNVLVTGILKPFTGTISNGDFSVQMDGLQPNKTYDLSLTATDELHNTGNVLQSCYTIPPLPVTELQLTVEPDSQTSANTLHWEGSTTPTAIVTLTLTPAKGQAVTSQVMADSKGYFAFNEQTMEGQYTASFLASAPGYQDNSLTGQVISVDQNGPTLMIDPNFQLTAGICTFKGKALDQSGQPEPKGSVNVKVTGIPKPFTGTISNGDFSVQMDGLQPGKTYDLSLTATDELQNTGPSVEKSFSLPGVHAPQAYDFAVTSLKSDTDSIVIRGTHPLENGRVSVHLSSDIIKKAGSKNQGIITQSAKDHKWNLLLKNLFQDQEVTVRFKAMDDAGDPTKAKFLPDIAEIQDKLIIGGKRESYFDSLSAENGIGTYGKHICISYNKVRLGKTKFPSKYVTLTSSNRADIEYKIIFDSKLSKGKLLPEHYQPSKLIIKYHTLEQLDTDVVVSVESPSLHYAFDNFQPGQDSLVSQTYPATAKISGSVDRVQGSIGSGLQLGKGVLQVEDFKDLFKGSYTICFDIKTSTKATKGSQPFPALAGYYDETSPTGAKTHLFGAFNEKGQIGVADHEKGLFAEPVVADNQWHSVCISRTLVSQEASTYRMLIDGKQADISKTGDSDVKKEQKIDHGTISNSPVSEYPVELLGGVTKSNSPDQVEYLNEAVLDNFTAYPISMETPYESSAYAHVHWNCSNGGACFYNSEFPAGLMIKEMMESRLTPHSPLYLQLKNGVANKSFTTSFTVKYQDKELDPQDSSVAGDNVYKLDSVSAKSLATVSVQPADPAAAHKFELHFDRTESDLIKGASMPDGIIKFDSSVSPLGSGISFGVGKNQSHSPANKDPNLILEARHLVTEPDTTINNYDIKHSIINLDGLQALKGIAQADDFSNKLLKLMSESSAESDANQVKLMPPCTQSDKGDSTSSNNPLPTTYPTSKAITDKTCTTDTTDPLVTINTVENNPAIALQLNGEVTYYQHT